MSTLTVSLPLLTLRASLGANRRFTIQILYLCLFQLFKIYLIITGYRNLLYLRPFETKTRLPRFSAPAVRHPLAPPFSYQSERCQHPSYGAGDRANVVYICQRRAHSMPACSTSGLLTANLRTVSSTTQMYQSEHTKLRAHRRLVSSFPQRTPIQLPDYAQRPPTPGSTVMVSKPSSQVLCAPDSVANTVMRWFACLSFRPTYLRYNSHWIETVHWGRRLSPVWVVLIALALCVQWNVPNEIRNPTINANWVTFP